MTAEEITEVLEKHLKWLNDEVGGERADLYRANLTGASLYGANLAGANLYRANLTVANLRCANLTDANLTRANLDGANLAGANLAGANLDGANLAGANLAGANLYRANLTGANLRCANLTDANLTRANLAGANLCDSILSDSILSGATLASVNLLSAAQWMRDNFETTKSGYIVYKTFGMHYEPPDGWVIKRGHVITDTPHPDRWTVCGCGINFATLDWIERENSKGAEVWKCLIEWRDLPDVVVPYNAKGKARCARLKLLKVVK